jgi:hypothetical protein
MEVQKKKIDGLLSLLANESTNKSRGLLKKYNQPDAKNHKDLELKLANLYKTSEDKKLMDKEFCEIHPHREFILKYTIKEPEKLEVESNNGITMSEDNVKDILKKYISETGEFSNCAGNPNCGCNKSSFSGYAESFGQPQQSLNNNTVTVALSVIGIVAILGIFMHHKH